MSRIFPGYSGYPDIVEFPDGDLESVEEFDEDDRCFCGSDDYRILTAGTLEWVTAAMTLGWFVKS